MLKTPKASNTSTKSRIPRPTTTNKSDCSQIEESTEKPIKKPEKKSQIAKPVKRRNDGIKKAKSPLEEISVSKKITAVVHQALAVNQALATARKTTAKPKLLSYKVANDELPDLQAKQEQDEYSTNDVKYAVLHEDEKLAHLMDHFPYDDPEVLKDVLIRMDGDLSGATALVFSFLDVCCK